MNADQKIEMLKFKLEQMYETLFALNPRRPKEYAIAVRHVEQIEIVKREIANCVAKGGTSKRSTQGGE